jgi:hypothetical protein
MKIYYFHSVLLIFSILFITTEQAQVKKMTISPSSVVSTNMDELSKLDRSKFIYPQKEGDEGPNIFPTEKPATIFKGGTNIISNILGTPSPAPDTTFLAQQDIPEIGGVTMWIPPDTWGAVSSTKLMCAHNNNVKVQDRKGQLLSIVSLATFWNPIPAISGTFDPRVEYDQYNDRWLMVSMSDAKTVNSSLLIAISNTNDPTGGWTEYRFVIGVNIQGSNCWADYPCVGFNKNWVAISVNMFTNAGSVFQESRILVISYPDLLIGKLPFPTTTLFFGIADFTVQPCITYSDSEEILYAPNHISSAGANYRLNMISGTSNAPMYTPGLAIVHSTLSAWSEPTGDILPQLQEPVTGNIAYISANDARIINAVYRNKNIYYAQTVGIPAGGLTYTAAQWVEIDTAGNYIQGGRIENQGATNQNGGKWYAFPSINVNAYGDILVGFSQFASNQAVATGYCLKDRTDALNTMEDPNIFKPGVSFYWNKSVEESRNRWGDYSFVQTDPSDNYHFWTIQEFADQQAGAGLGSGRWGTWWAKVQPVSPLPVEITYLISNVSGRQINLYWETKTELNLNKFEINRAIVSTKGAQLTWASVGTVQAKGSSNSPRKYSYIEKNLQAGKYQYRLKMIDNDGSYKYSSIVETEIALPKTFELSQNYPNPFNPSTRINYTIPFDSKVILDIYSITGKRIGQLVNEEQLAGYYSVDLNSSTINRSISSGVYFYRIITVDKATGNNFSSTKKMIFLK